MTASFAKREREKARQERAAVKRERRSTKAERPEADEAGSTRPQADVLAELQQLHEAHAAGSVDFESFEVAKAALVEELSR